MTAAAEQLCIDTVRTLSMDAIQKANSGHPGLPLAMAPAAYLLYAKVLKHDPKDPSWPDRDRFVLSAGHGSMLLYSALHLSGYDLTIEDLKAFRQWGSRTPGHPERGETAGVEVTTGPLGQGFANGIGMAMAEAFLRARYGAGVVDHHVYAICSDGDLMEGIASEAASLAGKLGLGKLVYLYDDNSISLDGPTSLSFDTEDVTKRFEAYGWQVLAVDDANDLLALQTAIDAGVAETTKPTLIRVKSIIGYPSPNRQGTSKAHGAPLGEEEIRATKQVMGWDPDAQFSVPDGVYETFGAAGVEGAAQRAAWQERFDAWRASEPELAQEWDLAAEGRPLPGVADVLAPEWGKDALATRVAGQKTMAAFAPFVPTMVGGAADLSESTKTEFPGGDDARFVSAQDPGRNVFFGVREHGMAGVVNGMAAHGGIVRPYGSTFMQFSDYMRGSIRLGALQNLPVAWVFTHDSVALGEDGPTHQPVEHIAALRAIPNLTVIRPADPNETAEAWRVILEDGLGPVALILSRQDLPVIDGPCEVGRGAYLLRGSEDAQAVIVGTGSEVVTALDAADLLAEQGVIVDVVSMPSWELFAAQSDDYQDSIIDPDLPAVSVEAGIAMGWSDWVDDSVSIERFGVSAPGGEALDRLGINAAAVVAKVKDLL